MSLANPLGSSHKSSTRQDILKFRFGLQLEFRGHGVIVSSVAIPPTPCLHFPSRQEFPGSRHRVGEAQAFDDDTFREGAEEAGRQGSVEHDEDTHIAVAPD